MYYDLIVIGAGIYGLYSAVKAAQFGKSILLIDCDANFMGRASYVNQARVHSGYHYPRSFTTAMKSAGYFDRFVKDFSFCINREFEQIYATSYQFSYTNGEQFQRFCEVSRIPAEEINPERYFKRGMCDRAFKTKEYAFDAVMLRDEFTRRIEKEKDITVMLDARITAAEKDGKEFSLTLDNGKGEIRTGFVLNTTYASVNQVSELFGFDLIKMKYELCEIILCDVDEELRSCGITVMDGPFFSIMPFGKRGLHSLTSVSFTPHETSYQPTPVFSCQKKTPKCTGAFLQNCNDCEHRPADAFGHMSALARKYLRDGMKIQYRGSLFSVKPILVESEVDDSRPTVIRKLSDSPIFYSVLAGKINTVYDLDEVLNE